MDSFGRRLHSSWPFAAGSGREICLATGILLAGLCIAFLFPGIPSALAVLPLAFLWALILFFFRDPDRSCPTGGHLVLSPADGRVVSVDQVEEQDFLKAQARRVSIFLSLFDVHVNRSPVSGTVELVKHRPGRFYQAFRPEASQQNEHNLLGIALGSERILVRQIAGVLARRVVCRARPGDRLQAGERFGLIKFGSRVEVYMPSEYEVRVRQGDRVIGGVTVIAGRPPAEEDRPQKGGSAR